MASKGSQGVERARYSIQSSFQNVADLAEQVGEFCNTATEAEQDHVDEIRLCVAEALNNIVEHAYEGAEGKPIHADVEVATGRMQVVLIDEGKPMPAYQIPETEVDFDPTDLENLPEGGFGWMLIREQMDEVEYERRGGCNVLTLAKLSGT